MKEVQNALINYLAAIEEKKNTLIITILPPVRPVFFRSISEVNEYKEKRTEAIEHNNTVLEKSRKIETEISNAINKLRKIIPVDNWIQVNVLKKTYYIGFQSSDWPMSTPHFRFMEDVPVYPMEKHIMK